MAENKVITLTALTPELTVSSGEKTANDTAKLIDTGDPSVNIETVFVGYGEDRLADPSLFKFIEDVARALDYINTFLGEGGLVQNVDTGLAQDLARLAVNKGINDLLSPSEDIAKSIFSIAVDIVANVEQVSKLILKDILDTANINETIALGFSKTLEDFSTTLEVVTFLLSTSFSLFDTITVTDDYLGEAVVDDDQVASFGKNIIEAITSSDIVTTALIAFINFNHVATPAETVSKTIATVLFDSANAIDSLVSTDIFNGAAITDSQTLVELISLNIGARLLDIANISDSIQNLIQPSYSESVTGSESIQKLIQSVYSEDATTTETISKAISTNLFDTANAIDLLVSANIFNGTAITDSQVLTELISFNIGNSVLDTTNISENVSIASGKTFNESLSSSDILISSFDKALTEVLGSLDSIVSSISIVLTDTTSVIDSVTTDFSGGGGLSGNPTDTSTISEYKFANMQNYFSSDYALQDYAGTNYII
jgi:hypothetical protein